MKAPPAPPEWYDTAADQYAADIATGVPWRTAWRHAEAEHERASMLAADACPWILPADYDRPVFDGDW